MSRRVGCRFTESLGRVATDRGPGVLVLLPAVMALQQVVQPVDGAPKCRVHGARVIGHGDRRLTRRSCLDHASDIGAGGSSAALVTEMNLDPGDVVTESRQRGRD